MYRKLVFETHVTYSIAAAIYLYKTCSCSSSITVNVASVFLIGLQLATLQKTTHKTNKQKQHNTPSPHKFVKLPTNPPPILFHQNIFCACHNSSKGNKFGDNMGFTPPHSKTSSTLRAKIGLGSKGLSGDTEPTHSTASTSCCCSIATATDVTTPVQARFSGRKAWVTWMGRRPSWGKGYTETPGQNTMVFFCLKKNRQFFWWGRGGGVGLDFFPGHI